MMRVVVDAPVINPETGIVTEIVRDADTGQVIGKNEYFPDINVEENPAKLSAKAKLSALGLTDEEIKALIG